MCLLSCTKLAPKLRKTLKFTAVAHQPKVSDSGGGRQHVVACVYTVMRMRWGAL